MLYEVNLDLLHPTQMTIGFKAVELRFQKMMSMSAEKLNKYLLKKPIPVVLGPERQLYLTDHHHLSSALVKMGVLKAYCEVQLDLSDLSLQDFWTVMGKRSLARARDTQGKKKSFFEIPSKFQDLQDDPYRSLASVVRKQGGFAKTPTPFAEFYWADYFRTRIPEPLLRQNFEESCILAGILACQPSAKHLPGFYTGSTRIPHDDPRLEIINFLKQQMPSLQLGDLKDLLKKSKSQVNQENPLKGRSLKGS